MYALRTLLNRIHDNGVDQQCPCCIHLIFQQHDTSHQNCRSNLLLVIKPFSGKSFLKMKCLPLSGPMLKILNGLSDFFFEEPFCNC